MTSVQISVIVPVFNVEQYIRKCLDQLLEQVFRDYEIILIDDGSTDSSGSICDEYASKDPRIKVIHQENRGLSAARNVGMAHATGKYLSFIDSDDFVDCAFLELLFSTCERTGAMIAECGFFSGSTDEEALFKLMLHSGTTTILNAYEASLRLRSKDAQSAAVVWNKLFRRELFDGIEFPPGKTHEDDFTVYRLLWKADIYAVLNDKLYFYRRRENSITSKPFSEQNMNAAYAYLEQADFYRQNNVNELEILSKACLCFFLREHSRDIRRVLPDAKRWMGEMRRAFWDVLSSRNTGLEKKAKTCFHYCSPWLYQKVRSLKRC